MLLISMASNGQEIHLSGGYNGSNVQEAGDEQWSGLAGYQFGADVLLGDRWFVKPGIHFLVRNLNYSYADAVGATQQEYEYTSRSLAIPLMLGRNLLDPSSDPSINLYVMGGPTALFGLNTDLDNNALTVETNSTQWYLGFGAGLHLGIFFVEGGYDVAMTNVFNGDEFETNPKVNYLHAIAGVRLQLAR
ncbi:MAG: porin family protein [Flavobacteriales bacterium]